MIAFPNCKINLGLRVLDKREDGYHNLDTFFLPVPLKEALEIIPSRDNTQASGIKFTATGMHIPGEHQNNLCYKAWELIKEQYPALPPVEIYLHKAIPPGAGLGGGSANGAFTLKLLNELFNLGISTNKLLELALQLGSDCPYFIINRPAYATGRGESLKEFDLNLAAYSLVILHPGIHVNTGWAFSQLSLQARSNRNDYKPLTEIISKPIQEWSRDLYNDFEAPVFYRYRSLALAKQSLYDAGAVYASMTGTGSSIYGIFHRDSTITIPKFDPSWQVYQLNLHQ